ncbi:MAG: hypothetical protein LBN95_04345, partial [Prevotellaceae bacterium]|nr:hypothetical protein [Prevotellaceae bacterium]
MVKKLIFVISLIVVVAFSANSQTLTVKERWNIKLGYSAYKTFCLTSKFIEFTDDESGLMYKRKSNVRLELNY